MYIENLNKKFENIVATNIVSKIILNFRIYLYVKIQIYIAKNNIYNSKPDAICAKKTFRYPYIWELL